MKNTIFIAFGIILAIGCIAFIPRCGSMQMQWGHHFAFDNELEIPIDSLEITVGSLSTLIYAGTDSLQSLEGNIDVPPTGYPHKVSINIYSHQKIIMMPADSFNCYNCDGNHLYTLTASGAVYQFLN